MKTINRLIDLAYCLGAAIVILGAWAKLLHKPGANTILTIGLLTEAALFVFMGIQEWTAKPEKSVLTGAEWDLKTITQANRRIDRDQSDLTNTIKETNNILRKVFNQ